MSIPRTTIPRTTIPRRGLTPSRRLLALASAALIGSWPLWGSAPAGAQEPPQASMALDSQSAWNGPTRPLNLSVDVTNASSEDLGDLSLVLVIQAPARSRSTYELSLREDPTPVIFGSQFPQPGMLRAGQTRTLSLEQGLDELTARHETALYPLKVQLLSGDLPVAEIRTPMVFLFDPVEAPLLLSWTWELSAALQYLPNGVFEPGTLEGDIAPGGRVASIVDTMRALGAVPLDLVASSALLDELERMADGYQIRDPDGTRRDVPAGTGGAANATALLDSLRTIAARPPTELLALPSADASIPALLRAGLSRDASVLLDLGRAQTAEALGRVPREDIYRPPGSDLDAGTLTALVRMGTETVIVDEAYAPASPGLALAAPPVIRLVAGKDEANAVRSEAAVETVARVASDPRLGAQAALGELAATWLELPGTTGRGVSLILPGRMSPATLAIFARLVRNSQWLNPVIASRLPALATPGARRAVPHHPSQDLDPGYVDQLLRARSTLNQFSRTAPQAVETINELEARLQTSLGATFIGAPDLGLRFIGSVRSQVRRIYGSVRVAPTTVTLASRTGFIPVTIENDSGMPYEVTVRLITDRRLEFTKGSSRRLTLPPGRQTFTFPARAQTTGRFPIKIQVRTPVDEAIAETIAETQIVVRSTAYNRVALVVTAGAALFLLMWWGRRFLPRRKAQAP